MLRTYDIPKRNEQLIAEIQSTFYNDLANLSLDENDITLHNIDFTIKNKVCKTIINILDLSKLKNNKICLTNGLTISHENCPLGYQPFLNNLLKIKPIYDELSIYQVNEIKNHFSNYNTNTNIKLMITDLAEKILEMGTFKKMISDVKQFIL